MESAALASGSTEPDTALPVSAPPGSGRGASQEPEGLYNNYNAEAFPSADEWQEIIEFHQHDAAWGGGELSGYRYYTEPQLTELADSGDLQAMRELIDRYQKLASLDRQSVGDMTLENEILINEETGNVFMTDELQSEIDKYRKKRNHYTHQAILHGDRSLLSRYQGYYDAQNQFSHAQKGEESHQAALEVLAHIEFFALRGREDTKYEDLYSFLAGWGQVNGRLPDEFSEEDRKVIRQRAQGIYDNLEQERMALGLGPFDNSVPKGKAQEYEWFNPVLKEMIEEETGYTGF